SVWLMKDVSVLTDRNQKSAIRLLMGRTKPIDEMQYDRPGEITGEWMPEYRLERAPIAVKNPMRCRHVALISNPLPPGELTRVLQCFDVRSWKHQHIMPSCALSSSVAFVIVCVWRLPPDSRTSCHHRPAPQLAHVSHSPITLPRRGVTHMINKALLNLAWKTVRKAVRWTPLLHSEYLDSVVGARVFLKAESLQIGGSFKMRGAYFRVSRLSRQQRKRGVVAFSSGNFA